MNKLKILFVFFVILNLVFVANLLDFSIPDFAFALLELVSSIDGVPDIHKDVLRLQEELASLKEITDFFSNLPVE